MDSVQIITTIVSALVTGGSMLVGFYFFIRKTLLSSRRQEAFTQVEIALKEGEAATQIAGWQKQLFDQWMKDRAKEIVDLKKEIIDLWQDHESCLLRSKEQEVEIRSLKKENDQQSVEMKQLKTEMADLRKRRDVENNQAP